MSRRLVFATLLASSLAIAEPADKRPTPVVARITNIAVVDDGVAITAGRGTDDGVAQGWRGCVIDTGERCMLGGTFVVTAANRRTSKAIVKLTPEQLREHPRVKLEPP